MMLVSIVQIAQAVSEVPVDGYIPITPDDFVLFQEKK
jgi:hypothetical protein